MGKNVQASLINSERHVTVPAVFVIDTSASIKNIINSDVIIDCVTRILRVLRQEILFWVPDRIEPFEGIDSIKCKPNVQYAVLTYNSSPKWLTDGFEDYYDDIVDINLNFKGLSDLGFALDELNRRLSVHAFLTGKKDICLPIIFFLTDGLCTDDFYKSYEKLNENIWFKHATKVSIVIKKCSNIHKDLAGSLETCFDITDLDTLLRSLHRIGIRSIDTIYEWYDDMLETSEYVKEELQLFRKGEESPSTENGKADPWGDHSDWD